MSLLKIIKIKKNDFNLIKGNSISLKFKIDLENGKVNNVENWLIISVKKKINPSFTIMKKINDVFVKRTINFDSPLILEYKIKKNKNKKFKIKNIGKYLN